MLSRVNREVSGGSRTASEPMFVTVSDRGVQTKVTMFADEIVSYSEGREQMEENLEVRRETKKVSENMTE